ncbi:MAG: hypothetical protein ACYS8W_17520 [Planctomycetota bacterium]|jgi:chromosome segregation ATPase
MTGIPKKKIDNPLFAPTAQSSKPVKGRPRDAKGRFQMIPKEPEQSVETLTEVRDKLIVENRISGIIETPDVENPTIMVSSIDGDTEVGAVSKDGFLPDIEQILSGVETTDDVKDVAEKGGKVLSVLEDLESELGDSFNENVTLREEVGATRKEISKLRAARESMREQLDEARGEVMQVRELKERFGKLETDVRVSEDKFLGAQKEIEFLQSEKKNLEFELHGAKSQVRELDRGNAEAVDEIRGLKEKVVLLEEIQASMDIAVQQKSRELERIPSLEAEIDALTTARDAIELDLKTSKKVLMKIREDMEVLETQYITVVEDRDSLAKKLASCESENIESAGRVQALAKELGHVRSEKKNQESELIVLKKYVGEIHNRLVATRSRSTKRVGANEE